MSQRSFLFEKCVLSLIVSGVLIVSALSFAQTPAPAPQPAKPAAIPPTLQSATRAEPAVFPKDTIIMTVGDHKLTAEEFNQILDLLPAQQKAFYSGPGKRQFADTFSQLIIFSDEARKEKLLDDPAVRQKLDLMANQTLAQVLVQRFTDNSRATDEEVRKYYEAHQKDYEEVKASHILIRAKGNPTPLPTGKKDLTEEEAKAKADEVYKNVSKPGADFAAIAKETSDDPGSAAKGGELGTFRHGQMVPAFETAAFAMNPGEIGAPIKTQFGYHIIKVDEKKTRSLEETKSEIESKLKQDKVQQQMDALKKSVKVDLNDQFFGPAPTPPAAVTPATPTPAPPAVKKP
jgi:peptidyl-prolyl cis-trans isomerase C